MKNPGGGENLDPQQELSELTKEKAGNGEKNGIEVNGGKLASSIFDRVDTKGKKALIKAENIALSGATPEKIPAPEIKPEPGAKQNPPTKKTPVVRPRGAKDWIEVGPGDIVIPNKQDMKVAEILNVRKDENTGRKKVRMEITDYEQIKDDQTGKIRSKPIRRIIERPEGEVIATIKQPESGYEKRTSGSPRDLQVGDRVKVGIRDKIKYFKITGVELPTEKGDGYFQFTQIDDKGNETGKTGRQTFTQFYENREEPITEIRKASLKQKTATPVKIPGNENPVEAPKPNAKKEETVPDFSIGDKKYIFIQQEGTEARVRELLPKGKLGPVEIIPMADVKLEQPSVNTEPKPTTEKKKAAPQTKAKIEKKLEEPKKPAGKSKTPESVKRTLGEAKEILDDLRSTEVPRIPDGLKVGDVINDKGEVFVVKEVKLSTPGDADDGGKFVFESIKDKAVLVMPFKEYREDAELRGTLQKRQEKIEGVPLNLQKGQSIWTPGGEEEVKVIDVVEKPNTNDAALKNGYVVLGFQPKEGRNNTYKEEVVPFSKIIRLRKNILLEKPEPKKPEETRPLMALIVKNQPVTNSPEEQFERIVKVPASDLKGEDAGKKIFKSGDQVSVENLGEGWRVLGTFYSEEQADKITADFEAFKSKEITKEQKRQEELEEAQKIREVLSQITTPNESEPEPPVVEAAPSSQFIERTINKKPWWKFWN